MYVVNSLSVRGHETARRKREGVDVCQLLLFVRIETLAMDVRLMSKLHNTFLSMFMNMYVSIACLTVCVIYCVALRPNSEFVVQ